MDATKPRLGLGACAVVLVSASLSLMSPAPVLAQGASSTPPEAVEFYRRGRDHFAAGRYREAIADLERAFALDPTSATLVYNLARVYELLGELDPSIQKYRQYLSMLGPDDDEERARVEETLQRLEGARDQVEAEMADPQPTPSGGGLEMNAPVRIEERGVADWLFWGTTLTSVALFAGGAIMGVLALNEESTAQSFVVGADGPLSLRDCIASTADTLALLTDVLFIAGGVAAVSATLLYLLRTRTVETHPGYDETSGFLTTDGHGILVGVRGTL